MCPPAQRASAAPALTGEEARQQAQAERLTLLVADNGTGYFGVKLEKSCKTKPYQARLTRGGKIMHLGSFATAEEAALCVARLPEGQEAAQRAAAAPPLTSEEARQQAQAERLTLRVGRSGKGYLGVNLNNPGKPKPYKVRGWRGGKQVQLGSFATAEEAALCVARTPEGKAAAERAAAAPPRTSGEALQQAKVEATRGRSLRRRRQVAAQRAATVQAPLRGMFIFTDLSIPLRPQSVQGEGPTLREAKRKASIPLHDVKRAHTTF